MPVVAHVCPNHSKPCTNYFYCLLSVMEKAEGGGMRGLSRAMVVIRCWRNQ